MEDASFLRKLEELSRSVASKSGYKKVPGPPTPKIPFIKMEDSLEKLRRELGGSKVTDEELTKMFSSHMGDAVDWAVESEKKRTVGGPLFSERMGFRKKDEMLENPIGKHLIALLEFAQVKGIVGSAHFKVTQFRDADCRTSYHLELLINDAPVLESSGTPERAWFQMLSQIIVHII